MTRIIGGTAGGRRLRTPPGAATRPTADRVREALFSSLESLLGGLAGVGVLDLYAGSGAIALEALSRGADRATAVESDRRTARLIRANADDLGLSVQVHDQPVERVLRRTPSAPYQLVVADPPYPLAEDELAVALGLVAENGWAAEHAIVVVERSARSVEPTWPPRMRRLRVKEYGETVLWYARVEAVAVPTPRPTR